MSRRTWTTQQIWDLGVKCDLATAASIFGVSRNHAYEMAAAGEFPVPVLRVGRFYKVPTAPIRRLLQIDDPPQAEAS